MNGLFFVKLEEVVPGPGFVSNSVVFCLTARDVCEAVLLGCAV
jgi:hypothetical protein